MCIPIFCNHQRNYFVAESSTASPRITDVSTTTFHIVPTATKTKIATTAMANESSSTAVSIGNTSTAVSGSNGHGKGEFCIHMHM